MGFFSEPEYITMTVVSQFFNYMTLKVYVLEFLSLCTSLQLSLFLSLVSIVITHKNIYKTI